jgi:uncharacterized protein (TIGR02284 family)
MRLVTPALEDNVDNDFMDHLKTLHTSEIDARNGYEEALEDAGAMGMTSLFRDMIALHDANADELGGILRNAGETANDEGSFMSAVHRAIMNVRSLFNGLDSSVLPGLIDGEKRNVEKYDQARKAGNDSSMDFLLTAQRDKIQQKIGLMEAKRAAHETATS